MDKKSKEKFAEEAMEAKDTPLDHWSKDTDPAVMAGDEWVDPQEDFGNKVIENEDLKKGIRTQSGTFMHPVFDVSYGED